MGEPMTHIAGLDVIVEDRYLRQRCAWCDAILMDYDLSTIAVPVGQDPGIGAWKVGELVHVDGGISHVLAEATLPDDFCGWAVLATPERIIGGAPGG